MLSSRFAGIVKALFALTALIAFSASAAPASVSTSPAGVDPALLQNLTWRNVGPAAMGGRVADVEGVPGDPAVVYVGSASGGIWKSTNGGTTWKPIFDDQPVASIGDLALEPGNPGVIYAGTGESNTRNSVSVGAGVYRSLDGGSTWRLMGLTETAHISRIVVNPRDPQQVFVGAVGHIYGPNDERGVFRSTDRGETWKKVLYIDNRHGASDLEIDPKNPNILFAGMWLFERKPWTHTSGSEQGGLFRSSDGGLTWKKIEKGLPKLIGRIGVKVAPSNPQIVYVMAESNEGTLFRSTDGGESFAKVNDSGAIVSRGFYYTDLRVDPSDENRVYAIAAGLFVSVDGGRAFKRASRKTHGDYHSIWIDPEDPRRIWQGQDGGIAVSYDRADSWIYVNNFPLGQFYQIYADNREPFYYVGGGLQDNGCWYGPGRNREPQGVLNHDWRMLNGGDGYYVVAHPKDPDLFLSESQAGGIVRTDMRTREQIDVSPQPRRNDGGPANGLTYRFNWNSPIIPSPHDPDTVYFCGNVVFRSKDFGLTWEVISPDLTTNDPKKQGDAGGPIWLENTTAEYHCTLLSFAESPAQAGVFWSGSDDGRLQVSQDGGRSWADVTKNVPGVPAFSPVSHVEPSRTAAGAAYAAFDRHMFDDFRPHLYKTTDFGKTWASVSGDLPARAYVHVLREDPKNQGLVYAGTELGLYASYDGCRKWIRLHLKNLPTVAVHDIVVHPRENDLILGTHGRGLWTFDDAGPLQKLTPEIVAKPAHLFETRPGLRFQSRDTLYGLGEGIYRAENPPYGAFITYHLKSKIEKDTPFKLEILKGTEVIREIKKAPKEVGLNRVAWNLMYDGPRKREDPGVEKKRPLTDYDQEDEDDPGPQSLPGVYTVRLTVGTDVMETAVEVMLDPALKVPVADLEKQLSANLDLRDMLSRVNDALRGLDSMRAQLEERQKLLASRKAPQELTKAVEDELKRLEEQTGKLQKAEEKRYWATGPVLSENLWALQWAINGVNAAPTTPQLAHLAELRDETKKGLEDLKRYVSDSLGGVNVKLREGGYPEVSLPASPAP